MMTTSPALTRLQAALQGSGLDGWLIYDFRGLNPFAAQLLDLRGEMLTRRWFLFIPAAGAATLIHHRIEENAWLQLLPDPALAAQTLQRAPGVGCRPAGDAGGRGADRDGDQPARRGALCELRGRRHGRARG